MRRALADGYELDDDRDRVDVDVVITLVDSRTERSTVSADPARTMIRLGPSRQG
jgi:hypothetical protein